MSSLALLLLADGRFPAGAGAYSGGLEEAVNDGRVHDMASLAVFVSGRLATIGRTDAALAAAAVVQGHRTGWPALVAETYARTPSPILREVSRRLGRLLLRTARGVWPLDPSIPDELPQPLALGAVVGAIGEGPSTGALLAAHGSVVVPALAAVRLLGFDPTAVMGVVARLEPEVAVAVAEAVALANGPLSELPGPGAMLIELAAHTHRDREVRLFAS